MCFSYGLILLCYVIDMVQLLYIIASLHALVCPFTKVEESFNIQAFHDILYHRHNLTQYDHNEFPGVVPRTFIGPFIISTLSSPIVCLLHVIGINKFWTQYVVRLTLALLVILSWNNLKNALQKQFGSTYVWWYTLLTVTQYHFMFYMSRPLPNIMALPLVLLAFEGWLSGKHKQFLISSGAAIIIFRSELAMLFGLFLIMDIYFKKIEMITLFKIVLPTGIALIALTVAIDSIFWGRILWPEAVVFWYNTALNKSSDWGTSPFLWYFYSALPRGLGPSLVLIPVGLYLDKRMVQVAAPALVYIILYSCLPHKELRFIIYVFPLLNMVSAAACSYIYVRRTKAPIYELLFWGITVVIIGNIVMSLAFMLVATTNYPGGVAITRFHKILKNEPFIHVHICNLAAQTGVTRFAQIKDNWKYSKNESLQLHQLQEYTHLLLEAKSKYSSKLKYFMSTHTVLDSIESFSHIAVNYKLMPPIKIKTKPAIFILERNDFREYPYGNKIISDNSIPIHEQSTFEYTSKEENMIEVDEIEDALNESAAEKDENILAYEITEDTDIKDVEISKESDDIVVDENSGKTVSGSEEILVEDPKANARKAIKELKTLRQERKKKVIEKIKSETRKEVVASAKDKLKEIMKRHKNIANELSKNMVSHVSDEQEKDGRGDIPDLILTDEIEMEPQLAIEMEEEQSLNSEVTNNVIEVEKANRTDENINSIVDEVITRLIDRKIYDDKTKPEDIKAEDRLVIQRIVEEVLSERMNYSKSDDK